jgi:hypothetical protein
MLWTCAFSLPRLVCKVRKASQHLLVTFFEFPNLPTFKILRLFFLLPNFWHCKCLWSFQHIATIQHPTSCCLTFCSCFVMFATMAAKSYCGKLVAAIDVMFAVKTLKFDLTCALSHFTLTSFLKFPLYQLHHYNTKCLNNLLNSCRVVVVMFACLKPCTSGSWDNVVTVGWLGVRLWRQQSWMVLYRILSWCFMDGYWFWGSWVQICSANHFNFVL